jgi:hypothetical protein
MDAARSLAVLALLACACPMVLSAPDRLTARGVVFHDVNGDGVRQRGEPGVPGVAVSNGDAVVRTDGQGHYRVDIDAHDAAIFVVKPRGWQVRLDAEHVPRHYYLHKPEGSPDDAFVYPGVEPTGPLPASVDFPLTPREEARRFTVVTFADPQVYTLEQLDFYRREVIDPLLDEDGNGLSATFGISLGDLVGDRLDLFDGLDAAQALFGMPWYSVYGNHDVNFMAGSDAATIDDPDRYADETFERAYGPPTHAFQYGDVHFVVLDDVHWDGFEGYREETAPGWPAERQPRNRNYRGALRPEQLRFVENYLATVPVDELVVLAMHIPLALDDAGEHRVEGARELLSILSTHPNTLSLSGHTHIQRHWLHGPEQGYAPPEGLGPDPHRRRYPGRFDAPVHHHLNAVTASGSWYNGLRDEVGVPHTTMRDGAPNGFTLLHFDGNRYRSEFRAARRPTTHQMTIHLAGSADGAPEGTVVAGSPSTVTVNVFNGAEGDTVEMRVAPNLALGRAPTPWRRLAFTPGIDPRYEAAWAFEQTLPEALVPGWGLPDPAVAHHLWSTEIVGDLPAGTHVLEVRHTDLYGAQHTGRRSIRVIEP